MADKVAKRTIVRQTTHASDSRPNIPTAELESFARPEEKRPATVPYPRDPTLDPQLVWKGKDEQDGHDLQVAAVQICIQETIEPARREAATAWHRHHRPDHRGTCGRSTTRRSPRVQLIDEWRSQCAHDD